MSTPVLKFNGIQLPVLPVEFAPELMDLDDAETSVRTADGVLNRVIIRHGVRKIPLSWGPLSAEQVSQILTLVKPGHVDVTYLDPESNYIETRTFYAGNRIAPHGVTVGGKTTYIGLKFTLTEI